MVSEIDTSSINDEAAMPYDQDYLDSQTKAHNAVRQAIKKGILTRPETCQVCGDSPKPSVYKRRIDDIIVTKPKIFAHHWRGYGEHALDVIWTCAKCNQLLHDDDCHNGDLTLDQTKERVMSKRTVPAWALKSMYDTQVALQSILDADSLDEAKAIAKQALTHPTG